MGPGDTGARRGLISDRGRYLVPLPDKEGSKMAREDTKLGPMACSNNLSLYRIGEDILHYLMERPLTDRKREDLREALGHIMEASAILRQYMTEEAADENTR